MPRQLRLEYPGAIYHVLNRGDQRDDIVRGGDDRHRFIATLEEACAKTDWQVRAHFLRNLEPRGDCERWKRFLTPRRKGAKAPRWIPQDFSKDFAG